VGFYVLDVTMPVEVFPPKPIESRLTWRMPKAPKVCNSGLQYFRPARRTGAHVELCRPVDERR
jgi:hypothetical protein